MSDVHDGDGPMAMVRARLNKQVDKVVVGQSHVVDATMVAMAVGGHLLLEGPPGVAKTLLVSAIGRGLRTRDSAGAVHTRHAALGPDRHADLTGKRARVPPWSHLHQYPARRRDQPDTPQDPGRVLLEAMQECQVTVDGVEHALPQPFTVLATQNPIEYEGTYPLPEAQLDRFLMKVVVTYPSAENEEALLKLRRSGIAPVTLSEVEAIARKEDLLAVRRQVDKVAVSDEIIAYVASLIRRTRELPSVALGASPRAGVHLLAAARAFATMAGRDFVVPEDVVALVGAVLAHSLAAHPRGGARQVHGRGRAFERPRLGHHPSLRLDKRRRGLCRRH